MTYSLNFCNLSGTFEKSFGLNGFSEDYYSLLNGFRYLEWDVNRVPILLRDYDVWTKQYRLFCKLAHFFDDFNFFINKSVAKRTEHDSKHSVDRRLHDFIRRAQSMKIPQQIQDTIVGFLKMQRAKAALVATRENSWLVPNLSQSKNPHMISGKPKNYSSTEEVIKRRLSMLAQISRTWQKFPELRLGQLISNSLSEGTDIFYVPDAKLIQLLKDFETHH